MSSFFPYLFALMVVLWQIDMAVNTGIAASMRPRKVRQSPPKVSCHQGCVSQPPKPPNTTSR